jgi:CBS domain-containing protein
MRVSEILHVKGFDVVTIRPDATVGDMITLLCDNNLGAVVVSTDGRSVAGIVTERDVVRRLLDEGDLLSRPVAAIMNSDVHTCRADDSVQSLMTTMTDQRIRHLPVVDDSGRMVGIVSIGDVVKSHITQLEFEREQLEGYLSR